MQHSLNRVVLQGRVGPPTVRLTPRGPVFASVEIEIADLPRTTITVVGIGTEAAGIAGLSLNEILRVEGELTLDPESGEFYVFAHEVARMVRRGVDLVPEFPTDAAYKKLERALLAER